MKFLKFKKLRMYSTYQFSKRVFCLLSFFFISFSSFSQKDNIITINDSEKVAMLSDFWKEVSYNFCDPIKLASIKWDSLYQVYLTQILHSKDDLEFYFILQRFAAELNDGHTLIWNFDIFSRFDSFDYLPIMPFLLNEKIFVIGIANDLINEVPLGSEIIKIGGLPAMEYVRQKIYPMCNGSTLQGKAKQASQILTWGNSSDSLELQFSSPDNCTFSIKLPYNTKKRNLKINESFSVLPSLYQSQKDDYTITDDKILYLRISNFLSRNSIDFMLSHKNEISDLKGIILDLRNNQGGNEQIADSLLLCFLETDTLFTYKSQTRINNAFYTSQGYGFKQFSDYYFNRKIDTLAVDTICKGELPYFSQPLIILIGSETCSAAEDLLLVLKEKYPDRAILIGTATSGSTGAPLVRKFRNGGFFKICTRKPITIPGLFENGIQPDILYIKKMSEYISNTDEIISLAKRVIHKSNKFNSFIYEGK